MEIRKAEQEDIKLVFENRMSFVREICGTEPTAEFEESTYCFLEKHISDGTLLVWLALDENALVSIVVLCIYEVLPNPSNFSGKTGLLLNVYTREDYRRKGIVTQLIKNILADAKALGVGKVVLNATDEGRYVYEKLGFEGVSREMALKL